MRSINLGIMVSHEATTTNAGPTAYALLIGIDKYNDGPGHDGAIYKDLRGCVNDVLDVEKLLRTQIPGIQITRMIAPLPGGPGSDLAIAADCVPTYANIVAAWRRLTETARANDIVYIHYSGHGGRAKTRFPDEKSAGLDESLAPCDVNDRDHGQYLRDVEIALLLQRMAERNLVTTVVLDSCCAGGSTRGDQAQRRSGDLPDLAPRGADAYASPVGTAEELTAVAQRLAHSPTDATWQLDATGQLTSSVTVLAACRQAEAAHEYAPEAGGHCGALTYFWRQALAQRGPKTTYRRIYDQVFAGVHNVFTGQTPLLLGEPDRVVFGDSVLRSRPSVPVRNVTDDGVELGAGASALVVRGVQLAIVPPDQVPELVDLAQMVTVEVQAVNGTTAVATRIPGTGGDAAIAVGAQGIVRSYPARMQRSIRLLVPAARSGDLAARIAADPSKLLGVAADGADFVVLVDDQTQTYRICDVAGAELPHVPATPIAAGDAAARVVELLTHLARYKNVLELANNDPDASLAGKLEVSVLAWPDYDPDAPRSTTPVAIPPGPAPIRDRDYFCLRIHNRSQRSLLCAALDLQPDWGIAAIFRDVPELAPGEIRDTALQANLPAGFPSGPEVERDVLKVIAALGGSNLEPSLMTLPALGQPRRAPQRRGPGESALDELIRILQDPLEGSRHVTLAHSPSSGWTVAQVELAISRPSKTC